MISPSLPPEWLRQYGNAREYAWQQTTLNGRTSFRRPIGLVEYSFDTDGRYFEGRADMNCLLQLAIKKDAKLSKALFQERVLLAWTRLRSQHILLQARTSKEEDCTAPGTKSFAPQGLHFVVDVAKSVEEARDAAKRHIVFLEDMYDHVDPHDFYQHCQNASRVVDANVALAKAFVLPTVVENGQMVLRVQFVGAHMIWDGLSSYVWMRDFIQCLNESPSTLRAHIAEYIKPSSIQSRAPLPQEALYPPIHPGNKARQRWFWAITRVLRHCRTPLPEGFDNPLRRTTRRDPVAVSPTYSAVLNYDRTPPFNTVPIHLKIPATEFQRLHRICKESSASIGAGIFALVALTMMECYEEREPEVKPQDRKCFITGFPLNPRAFFNHHNDPDSMMLAFSDGISLPFLSSNLDLEGRLRLLARQAHRQLASYQKRSKPSGHDAKQQYLNSRGAGLVLANQYFYSLERNKMLDVQGQYPARQNPTTQTCGVSSVGLRDKLIKSGVYDLNDPTKDFVADFQDLIASVRAREGEFLVGAGGTSDGLFVAASVDMSTMDAGLVGRWSRRFEHVLDSGMAKL